MGAICTTTRRSRRQDGTSETRVQPGCRNQFHPPAHLQSTVGAVSRLLVHTRARSQTEGGNPGPEQPRGPNSSPSRSFMNGLRRTGTGCAELALRNLGLCIRPLGGAQDMPTGFARQFWTRRVTSSTFPRSPLENLGWCWLAPAVGTTPPQTGLASNRDAKGRSQAGRGPNMRESLRACTQSTRGATPRCSTPFCPLRSSLWLSTVKGPPRKYRNPRQTRSKNQRRP